MARRERTTGLPRPRPRERAASGRRFAGITWNQGHARWFILGGAIAALFVVLGFIAYQWYDANIATPNRVVLQVGNDKIRLNYYTNRLYDYLQSNSPQNASDVQLLEEQLLNQLQQEALTVQLAQKKGVNLSDSAITSEIASELGVPVGGPGSSFDTLYRAKLTSTHMTDSSYRLMAEANLAKSKLLAIYQKQEPSSGELVTIQKVVLASKSAAQKALNEVKSGQDLGTVAQKESTDLQSKQNNGLMNATPPTLLDQPIQTAIKGKQAGDQLIGPVQDGSDWWVFRITRIDQKGTYSTAQKQQLAQITLNNALAQAAKTTTIVRNLTTADLNWASTHAG